MSSASANFEDRLLSVKYTRVQPKSPEFLTIYEGIDQSVDVNLSTFVFRAAPEPLVSLYGFIMTTFVPEQRGVATQPQLSGSQNTQGSVVAVQNATQEKIRVLVKLASVRGRFGRCFV